MHAHASLPSVSNILFGLGRNAFGTKAISWTGDTIKATLLTMSSAAGKIFLVTAASNATPIVLTVASTTGITAGDILVVGGVGGNLAANGTWQAGTVTGTTVQLLTRLDGVSSTGSAAYTSGGWIVDTSSASVLSDVSGNSNGTDPTVSGTAMTLGVATCSTISWTAGLAATKVWGAAIYSSTASNDLIEFIDGCVQIYVTTQAAASATAIAVQRLTAAIASGTVITFSDGASATLSGAAAVGDTSLSVSALAAIVHRQATADVQALSTGGAGSGLPFTPAAGGSVSLVVDTGVNHLFAL